MIAGGMVTKAGPAATEPSAVIIPITTANLFTGKGKPRRVLCKPEVLERVGEIAKGDDGEAEKEKKANHIGDGCQHDRGGERRVNPQRP